MATLEELVVKIKADTADINAKLDGLTNNVKRQTKQMETAFGGIRRQLVDLLPAVTVTALAAFAKGALTSADAINDMAQQVGIAGSTLSALNISLLQSGSSLEQFSSSIVRMNNSVGEARKGNQEAVKAFDSLGLSVAKLAQLTPEQQFVQVANALGRIRDQSTFTETGINLFGRSFATLAPLIRDAGGDMQGFIDKQKEMGRGLSEEELARIDEWGDRWTSAIEHAKLALVDYLNFFYQLGQDTRRFFDDRGLPANVSRTRPTTLSDEEAAKMIRDSARKAGLDVPDPADARGGNAGLLRDKELESATEAYRDYIKAIEDENYLLHINEQERDGVRAVMEAEALAKKANIDLSEEERQHIMATTNANRELKESMAEAQRFGRELHDKLSDGLADIVFSFDSATDSAKRFAEQIAKMIIEKKITGPLADGILGMLGGSSGSSGGGLLDGLFGGGSGGSMRQVGIGYAGSGYTGGYTSGGSGGLLGGIDNFFSGLGFADGGRPPVGKASWVGEDGPELFVPDSAGTVVPNGEIGGKQITVVQNWNISPGVQGTVEQEIRRVAPGIINQSVAATLAAIEKGGRAAQIVGRRN